MKQAVRSRCNTSKFRGTAKRCATYCTGFRNWEKRHRPGHAVLTRGYVPNDAKYFNIHKATTLNITYHLEERTGSKNS